MAYPWDATYGIIRRTKVKQIFVSILQSTETFTKIRNIYIWFVSYTFQLKLAFYIFPNKNSLQLWKMFHKIFLVQYSKFNICIVLYIKFWFFNWHLKMIAKLCKRICYFPGSPFRCNSLSTIGAWQSVRPDFSFNDLTANNFCDVSIWLEVD